MKKKILFILTLLFVLVGIVGCGDKKNTDEEKKDEKKYYSLGDIVETDIARFQLHAGQFAYALENSVNNNYALPKEYDPADELNNPYVAAKGHTLVAFTFYIENLDRASLNIGGSFNGKFITVSYKNKQYGTSHDQIAVFKGESENALSWSSYSSSNLLIHPGEKLYYRSYIDMPVDVKDLNDTVELTVYLPTSENKNKEFTFRVSDENRKNYKGIEITEEVAIKNLNYQAAKDYFNNNLSKYRTLTGSEIKTAIEGTKFNVTEIGNGTWKGTFTFEKSGKIFEGGNKYATGYVNKRTWKINKDLLVLSWVNDKGNTFSTPNEVRFVKDGVYLLLSNGNISGILYK